MKPHAYPSGTRDAAGSWLRRLLLLGLVAVAGPWLLAQTGPETRVWLVGLDGALGPANSDYLQRSIADAEADGAEAIIIRMDTPGGLDKSMRDLVKVILGARIPVITYVAPNGSRAASAGTYIAYASHIAAMAPATNIGSSTPVSIGPPLPDTDPLPGNDPKPAEESAGSESGDDSAAERTQDPAPSIGGDAMSRKVINDAVAYIQGLAELRGRNVAWAEETVRRGSNLRASEALEKNVIDLIADSVPDLLNQLDGRTVTVAGTARVLRTAGAVVEEKQPDWRHELLEVITDPTIAYGMLIFGLYALVLEFYSPGLIFPSIIGIILILLGAYGLQMLPVNYAGLALLIVGIGMMVAEVLTPTLGLLGVGGVVAFVFGSIMLLDTEMPGYRIPMGIIAAFAVSSAVVVMLTLGAVMGARRQKVVTGKEALVGATGEVVDAIDGEGRVRVAGEIWNARSDAAIPAGTRIRVMAIDGLTLTVTLEE